MFFICSCGTTGSFSGNENTIFSIRLFCTYTLINTHPCQLIILRTELCRFCYLLLRPQMYPSPNVQLVGVCIMYHRETVMHCTIVLHQPQPSLSEMWIRRDDGYQPLLTQTYRNMSRQVWTVHREVLHAVAVPLHKSFSKEVKAFLQADSQV